MRGLTVLQWAAHQPLHPRPSKAWSVRFGNEQRDLTTDETRQVGDDEACVIESVRSVVALLRG